MTNLIEQRNLIEDAVAQFSREHPGRGEGHLREYLTQAMEYVDLGYVMETKVCALNGMDRARMGGLSTCEIQVETLYSDCIRQGRGICVHALAYWLHHFINRTDSVAPWRRIEAHVLPRGRARQCAECGKEIANGEIYWGSDTMQCDFADERANGAWHRDKTYDTPCWIAIKGMPPRTSPSPFAENAHQRSRRVVVTPVQIAPAECDADVLRELTEIMATVGTRDRRLILNFARRVRAVTLAALTPEPV